MIHLALLVALVGSTAPGPCTGHDFCTDLGAFAVRITHEITAESAGSSGDAAQRKLIESMVEKKFFFTLLWTSEERGAVMLSSLPVVRLKDGRRIEATDVVFSRGEAVQFVNPPVVCSDEVTDRWNSHALAIALAFPRTDAAGRRWTLGDVGELILDGGNR